MDALFARRRDLLAAERDIAELEATLIVRGAGKHTGNGDGHECTVVAAGQPGVKYAPVTGDDADAAKAICGDSWSELFERKVTLEPRKGFEDRADAVLNAAPKAKLFALIGKPTSARKPYVLYPKLVAA